MKSHGYDALDYAAFIHSENPIFHVSPSEFESTLRREREMIEEAGLFVNQTHGVWRCPARESSEYDRAERFAAMVTGVSLIPEASFARVLPVHGAMMSASRDTLGPMGSASAMV